MLTLIDSYFGKNYHHIKHTGLKQPSPNQLRDSEYIYLQSCKTCVLIFKK